MIFICFPPIIIKCGYPHLLVHIVTNQKKPTGYSSIMPQHLSRKTHGTTTQLSHYKTKQIARAIHNVSHCHGVFVFLNGYLLSAAFFFFFTDLYVRRHSARLPGCQQRYSRCLASTTVSLWNLVTPFLLGHSSGLPYLLHVMLLHKQLLPVHPSEIQRRLLATRHFL